MAGFSVSKKSAYGVLFRDLRRFPLAPMGLPGGKRRKETLHSKASESAAHVAGFGLHLEGFGPPTLPKGFFDNLKRRRNVPPALRNGCVFCDRALRSVSEGNGVRTSIFPKNKSSR